MAQQSGLRMSMVQRIYFTIAIFIVTVVTVIGISLFSITRLSQMFDSAGRTTRQELLYATLDRLAAEQAAAVFGFLAGKNDGGTADTVKDALESIHGEGRNALAESMDSDIVFYAVRAEAAEQRWKKCHEAAAAFVSGGSGEEWTEARNTFIEFMRDVAESFAQGTLHRREETAQAMERFTNILIMVVCVGTVIALIAACITVEAVQKRLRRFVDSLIAISAQARSSADGGGDSAWAVSASVADAAEELSRILNGAEKPRRPAGTKEAQTGAPDRQYADWANLPADVRAALLILARRLGETRDER